jgi:hypothetical protein
MGWTEKDLWDADLRFGTADDSYVLHLPKTANKDGKVLKIPGYFVGDPKLVCTLQRAATVVRTRLPEEIAKRSVKRDSEP